MYSIPLNSYQAICMYQEATINLEMDRIFCNIESFVWRIYIDVWCIHLSKMKNLIIEK